MSDLIERQKAIELIHSLYPSAPIMRMNRERWEKKYKPYIEAEKALEMLPSAQPELIRCRDCKFWQDQEEGVIEVPICARPENKYEKLPFRIFIGEDGFCSYAERRTDEGGSG